MAHGIIAIIPIEKNRKEEIDRTLKHVKLASKSLENFKDKSNIPSFNFKLLDTVLNQGGDVIKTFELELKHLLVIEKENGTYDLAEITDIFQLFTTILLVFLRNSLYHHLLNRIWKPISVNNLKEFGIKIENNNQQLSLEEIFEVFLKAIDDRIHTCSKEVSLREHDDPNSPQWALEHQILAFLYFMKSDYKFVIEHLEKSIAVNTFNHGEQYSQLAHDYYNLASAQFSYGDYRQSIASIRKSSEIGLTPEEELENRCLVSRCYDALGQNDIATQKIEEAITFRHENDIDTRYVENYAECMEIYDRSA